MKVRPRLVVARLVKDVVAHHLNNAQPNVSRKIDRLVQDLLPVPAELWRMAAERIFAMTAQAHRHDAHAGVVDGTTQRRPLRSRPIQPAQAFVTLVNRYLDKVIAGLARGGEAFFPAQGSGECFFVETNGHLEHGKISNHDALGQRNRRCYAFTFSRDQQVVDDDGDEEHAAHRHGLPVGGDDGHQAGRHAHDDNGADHRLRDRSFASGEGGSPQQHGDDAGESPSRRPRADRPATCSWRAPPQPARRRIRR